MLPKQIQSEHVFFAFIASCLYIGASSILGSSYLGLFGHHIWRQTEVIGHIFGFMQQHGFAPFDRFILGDREIFDIPIYQFIIAKLSLFFHTDPLVTTRHCNFLIWLFTGYSGLQFLLMYNQRFAKYIFLTLFTTSPLFLHYFSVPLPDLLSLWLSVWGFTIALQDKKNFYFCLIPLLLATLIKSPIPFIFTVFYLVLLREKWKTTSKPFLIRQLVFLVSLLVFAFLAEWLRKFLVPPEGEIAVFAQDPEWYFGTLALRIDPFFWKILWNRLELTMGFQFGLIYLIVFLFLIATKRNSINIRIMLGGMLSYLAGFLVFANVFYQHDYYQIPSIYVLILCFSVGFSSFIEISLQRLSHISQHRFKIAMVVFLFVTLLSKPFFQKSLSVKSRTTVFDSMEYFLSETDHFLYVTTAKAPNIGGLTLTKFTPVLPEEFEKSCTSYIQKFPYIVVGGYLSPCLINHKHLARSFFQDKTFIFFAKDKLHSMNMNSNTYKTNLNSGYFVELFTNFIKLTKNPCSFQEVSAPFIVVGLKNIVGAEPQIVFQKIYESLTFGTFRQDQCTLILPITESISDTLIIGQIDAKQNFLWSTTLQSKRPLVKD